MQDSKDFEKQGTKFEESLVIGGDIGQGLLRSVNVAVREGWNPI